VLCSTRLRTSSGVVAAAPQHAQPGSRVLGEAPQQRRLADAGLAGDDHDAARACRRIPDRRAEPVEGGAALEHATGPTLGRVP
jgi:hypothetical protein